MFSEVFRQRLEKLHQYKIFGVELDIIFMLFISYWISWNYNVNFYKTLLYVIIISIIVHRIFRINTTLNKYIFGVV